MNNVFLNRPCRLLLLLAACLLGCSSDVGGSPAPDAAVPEPALLIRENMDDVRLMIWLDGAEITVIAEDLSPALIEEKLRATGWSTRDPYPEIWIQRGSHQIYSVCMHGWLNAEEPEDALRVRWSGRSSRTGAGRTNLSRPLKSVDEGIALLISYFSDDDQWKNLVEWEYEWDSL